RDPLRQLEHRVPHRRRGYAVRRRIARAALVRPAAAADGHRDDAPRPHRGRARAPDGGLRAMKLAAVVVVVVVWATAAAAFDRFFVMGDGRLSLVNAHTDARVDVRYRRTDGKYDEAAIGQIRRAFRSVGDEGDGKASLRLIEILSKLQKDTGVRPLTLMSGYRSPTY